MIKLYSKSRLTRLANALSDVIKDPVPGSSAFAKETIVVGGPAMARWLNLYFAEHRGISVNLECPFPGGFVNNMVFQPMNSSEIPDAETEHDLPFSVENMTWRIMAALPEFEGDSDFKPVIDYVGTGPDAELKRYQLSARLASTYDRYVNYRPDVIKNWGQSIPTDVDAKLLWQPKLWRHIRDKKRFQSFADLFYQFMEDCKSGRAKTYLTELAKKKRISFFGFSSLPPAYLSIIDAISEVADVDVHFFYYPPSQEFFEDCKSEKARLAEFIELSAKAGSKISSSDGMAGGNPLLGSMGMSAVQFFRMLNGFVTEEPMSADMESDDAEPQSVLGRLQMDVRTDLGPTETEVTIEWDALTMPEGDTSLEIHLCHSPMREVEVLYENLLDAFQADKTLMPRNVVVLAPDLKTYAPYIQAVFGSHYSTESKFIPFSIADRNLGDEYPEARAFVQALDLLASRFSATEVVGLLEMAAVRDRFGLGEQDIDSVRMQLKRAGFAWGLDKDMRTDLTEQPFDENSWEFAEKRLVFGYAMQPGEDGSLFETAEDELIAPDADVEGSESVLCGLIDFVSTLITFRKRLMQADAGDRNGAWWQAYLRDFCDGIISSSSPFADGRLCVRRCIDALRVYLSDEIMCKLTVSLPVVKAFISEHMDTRTTRAGYHGGGVTFSRFQPMRNIPAKVVCMLGMNDGSMPQQDRQLNVDMLDQSPRACDPSLKADDRLAFLEALLAAGNRAIISYVGQDIKTNDPVPPSVLVSEVRDYVDSRFCVDDALLKENPKLKPSELLVVKHPLQAFSPKYFMVDPKKKDSRLRSYSSSNQLLAAAMIGEKKAVPRDERPLCKTKRTDQETLYLDELIWFFKEPCKYFYEQCVGVYRDMKELDRPEDSEPSSVGSLEQYSIKYEAMVSKIEGLGDGLQDGYERFRALGQLPVGAAGRVVFDDAWTKGVEFADRFQAQRGPSDAFVLPEIKVPLQINGRNVQLAARLRDCYSVGQVFGRPSKEKTKDILHDWLYHLFLCAIGPSEPDLPTEFIAMPRVTLGIYDDDTGGQYAAVPGDIARNHLEAVLGFYLQGCKKPLCFWPASAQAWIEGDESYDAANGKWKVNTFSPYPYWPSAYTRDRFGEELPGGDSDGYGEFCDLSKALLVPAFDCRNKLEEIEERRDEE